MLEAIVTNETEQTGTDGADPQHAQSQMSDALAKLNGPGEPLIALGAVLMVVVDLVGDVIMEDYSIPYMVLTPALLIVLAIVGYRFLSVGLPVGYGTVVAILALVAGVTMARELVDDIHYDVLDRGGATVVFALLAYLGGALLLVGSWQLWSSLPKQS